MNDVGAHRFHHFRKPGLQRFHQVPIFHNRQLRCQTGCRRSAIESPVVDVLLALLTTMLLGTSQVERFPSQGALLVEDGERAEGISAMQG